MGEREELPVKKRVWETFPNPESKQEIAILTYWHLMMKIYFRVGGGGILPSSSLSFFTQCRGNQISQNTFNYISLDAPSTPEFLLNILNLA